MAYFQRALADFLAIVGCWLADCSLDLDSAPFNLPGLPPVRFDGVFYHIGVVRGSRQTTYPMLRDNMGAAVWVKSNLVPLNFTRNGFTDPIFTQGPGPQRGSDFKLTYNHFWGGVLEFDLQRGWG
jgi:hypothetical protein